MNVDETVEVNVPVRTAYNQWTQFEDYPQFMEGVKQVEQLDDSRLHWVAEIGGETKEWYAHITRQVPDQILAWESDEGTPNSGTVVFRSLDERRSEIELHMQVSPEGVKEQVGVAAGIPARQVESDLRRFKDFIESRGRETGAWRGEIEHGAATPENAQEKAKGYD